MFDRGDDVILLLTIPATGIGLFGILSFDASQQDYILLNKSVPENMGRHRLAKRSKTRRSSSSIGQRMPSTFHSSQSYKSHLFTTRRSS